MTHRPRLGPPPLEPLSDAAWSRIERHVWAQLDAPSAVQPRAATAGTHRRALIAIPSALAAAAVIALLVRGSTPEGDGVSSRLVTGPAAATSSFGDIEIELAPASTVVTRHEASRPVAVLERGAAWFTVAPRAQRPAFVVEAGGARIRVIGTRFRVARFAEQTAVEVEHGVVEIQLGATTASVAARQRWSSRAPGEVETIAATPSAPAAPRDDMTSTTPAGTAAPPAGAVIATVPTDAAIATAPADVAAVQPSPSPPKPTIHRSAPATPSRAASPTSPTTRVAPTENRPAQASPPPDANASPDTAERDHAEYERLANLEPRSPDAALAGYLELARRPGPWADPALFAAARLAADRGDRRARALLESYLARFPRGANAADASQLLVRLRGP